MHGQGRASFFTYSLVPSRNKSLKITSFRVFAHYKTEVKDAFRLVVATATEYNHNSQNNDPGAVVVEEMAQAVVVHICFPPNVTLRVFSLA